MPHHFRTIEAFVQLLEQSRDDWKAAATADQPAGFQREVLGRAASLDYVLAIVRTSNIGIVYPPPEQEPREVCSTYHSRAVGVACSNCGHYKEAHRSIERDEDGLPWVVEPNVTRCPDCGIEVPCIITGIHVCYDGQVRGFRISP